MPNSKQDQDAVDAAIDQAARDLFSNARLAVKQQSSWHPEVDDLVAYQEGTASSELVERIRDHLTVCDACAHEVLDLASFDREPPDVEWVPDPQEADEDWASFKRLVAGAASSAAPKSTSEQELLLPFPSPADLGRAPGRSARRWGTLAAAILFAASGLAFWMQGIAVRQSPTTQALPRLLILDLTPDEDRAVRDASPAPVVDVPREIEALTLRLRLGDPKPYDTFRAELRNAGGDLISTYDKVQRQRDGSLAAQLPRLEAGLYHLRLIGTLFGQERPITTYSFMLRESPGSAPSD